MKKSTDVGQVLWGAVKHRYGAFAGLDALIPDDVDEYFDRKRLPNVSIEQMKSEGYSEAVAIALHILPKFVGVKPKTAGKLVAWVEHIKSILSLMKSLALDVSLTSESVLNLAIKSNLQESYIGRLRAGFLLGAENIEHIGNSTVVLRTVKSGYMFFGYHGFSIGTSPDMSVDQYRQYVIRESKEHEARKAQRSARAKSKKSKRPFGVYRDNITSELYIGYKGLFGVIPLVRNISSQKEGFAFIAEREEELEQLLQKQRPEERFHDDSLIRKGKLWLTHGTVDSERLLKEFAFRGVQYGNYVTDGQRGTFNRDAFNAFHDFVDILQLSPAAVGFNGTLGFAYGARGKGGHQAFLAHFEPHGFNINLVKGKGIGSFGHEWGHAMDSACGAFLLKGSTSNTANNVYASLLCSERDVAKSDLRDAFITVVKLINSSKLVVRSQNLDNFRNKVYWATTIEMFARSFERWLLYKLDCAGCVSPLLVSLSKAHEGGEGYPYPTQAELDSGLSNAFENLMNEFRKIRWG